MRPDDVALLRSALAKEFEVSDQDQDQDRDMERSVVPPARSPAPGGGADGYLQAKSLALRRSGGPAGLPAVRRQAINKHAL
jgi:hypothetical protein